MYIKKINNKTKLKDVFKDFENNLNSLDDVILIHNNKSINATKFIPEEFPLILVIGNYGSGCSFGKLEMFVIYKKCFL